MTKLKTTLLAAALLATTSVPSVAVANPALVASLNARIGELTSQMADVQALLAAGGPPQQIMLLQRQQQMLNIRRGQLISLSRIVPTLPTQVIPQVSEQIITFQDEDVSAS